MTIKLDVERVDSGLVARFNAVRMDAVVGQLAGSAIAAAQIKPLHGFPRFAGSAITVKMAGPDFRMAVLALGAARAGDVIVIAVDGRVDGAAWGAGLTLSADEIGCAAVVVDGAATDRAEIVKCQTPVYARDVTLARAPVPALGSINVAVDFAGIRIAPGDLVMGDADGICVVPRPEMHAILAAAEAETARVEANIQRLKGSGKTLFDLRGGAGFAKSLGLNWPSSTTP